MFFRTSTSPTIRVCKNSLPTARAPVTAASHLGDALLYVRQGGPPNSAQSVPPSAISRRYRRTRRREASSCPVNDRVHTEQYFLVSPLNRCTTASLAFLTLLRSRRFQGSDSPVPVPCSSQFLYISSLPNSSVSVGRMPSTTTSSSAPLVSVLNGFHRGASIIRWPQTLQKRCRLRQQGLNFSQTGGFLNLLLIRGFISLGVDVLRDRLSVRDLHIGPRLTRFILSPTIPCHRRRRPAW